IEFLKRETSRVRVRKVGTSTYLVEGEVSRQRMRDLPTDFIDILFLRNEPTEQVVVEKSLIRELRYRLEELEKETKKLRWENRLLEVSLAICIVLIIISLLI
ncbi:MAG: hypothetical protein QXY49_06625, partial [Thermofilaceae archaeon]